MPDIEYKVCVPKWVCPFSLLAVVLPEVGWAQSTFLDNSLSTVLPNVQHFYGKLAYRRRVTLAHYSSFVD